MSKMKNPVRLMQAFPLPRFFQGLSVPGFARAAGLCLALCMVLPVCMAQNLSHGSASEARVKAAFLYKFLNYVEWPVASFARRDSPYVMGILGAGEIEHELTSLSAGRNVNERPVTVKRVRAGDSLNDVHVLFVGKAEKAILPQLLKSLQSAPVLVVTETEGALAQGSMINFRVIDERVRFEVALGPAEKAGLKLNSRLLAVASSVMKGTQQ